MEKKNVENRIEELKEELKKNNTETVATEDNSKVRKIIKTVLQGVALVATGIVGFFIGRGIGNGKDDEEDQTTETNE